MFRYCALFNQLILSKPIVLALIVAFCPFFSQAQEKVVVGLLAAKDIDRDVYLDFVNRFSKQYPGASFDHIAANDAIYKLEINDWLNRGKVDISYGQVGSRMCRHAAQKQIAPLNDLWLENNLDDVFPLMFKQAVTCDGQVYGVPFTYYYWGFFYKKSIFKRFGLTAPQTWDQFLQVSETLKLQGLIPITIGTKNNWPAAAWFDYINLRINGLAFHLEVLQGRHSFLSLKVRKVFEHWKVLIDNGYFISDQKQLDWQQAMPFLYRDMAGMTLVGGFLPSVIPEHLKEDIDFFRFPSIDSTMPMYEEVPIEVNMLNMKATQNKAAKALLVYSTHEKNQLWLSQKLGYLPPNFGLETPQDKFSKIGENLVKNAAGYSQYFDRDAHMLMAQNGPKILADFLESGDIDMAVEAFEYIRKQIAKE